MSSHPVPTPEFTVAAYLKVRLEQLGLDRMFGVAGNYTAAFLDTILVDPASPITISSNANELCAGYAADAYARYRGIGAVYVTYSVGAFSLLNTIAGSFIERVPVLLVNGAPTNKETSIEANAGLLYSHTTRNALADVDVFRPFTAAAERITDGTRAPFQIDSVLTAMLTEHRPGYVEVTEDVWRAPCSAPAGRLAAGSGAIITVSDASAAVEATLELLRSRTRAVLWAGVELQRYGLQSEFLGLLGAANAAAADGEVIDFVTTASGKSVISESHPRFAGCVTLSQREIDTLLGDDGCLIGLGGWTTSKNTGSENIRGPGTVLAATDGVTVGARFFPLVDLHAFIVGLTERLAGHVDSAPAERFRLSRLTVPPHLVATVPTATAPVATASIATAPVATASIAATAATAAAGEGSAATTEPGITYDSFFRALGDWVTASDIVVADAGFPLIGAQALPIAERNGFVAQASWLAIGYSVPAATGVKCANPAKRAVVVVGDGAFHETCQAVSDHHAHGHDTVVFVISNGLYGIEQFLVNPNPFRDPPLDYPQHTLQNAPYSYNELPAWDFVALAGAFGGLGRRVCTQAELDTVLAEIRSAPESNVVVEVVVPRLDTPGALSTSGVGEDETANPGWPPAATF
jgi:indolepyruvate decarboxylase